MTDKEKAEASPAKSKRGPFLQRLIDNLTLWRTADGMRASYLGWAWYEELRHIILRGQ